MSLKIIIFKSITDKSCSIIEFIDTLSPLKLWGLSIIITQLLYLSLAKEIISLLSVLITKLSNKFVLAYQQYEKEVSHKSSSNFYLEFFLNCLSWVIKPTCYSDLPKRDLIKFLRYLYK